MLGVTAWQSRHTEIRTPESKLMQIAVSTWSTWLDCEKKCRCGTSGVPKSTNSSDMVWIAVTDAPYPSLYYVMDERVIKSRHRRTIRFALFGLVNNVQKLHLQGMSWLR